MGYQQKQWPEIQETWDLVLLLSLTSYMALVKALKMP